MTHRCIDESQLDRLLELAEDHPDRRDANACARCRTLLIQYAAFKAEHIPKEARYEEAGPALARFKESLFSNSMRATPPVYPKSFSFRSFFRKARVRLAWGAVAVAVLALIAFTTWAPWNEREIVPRGEMSGQEPRIELPELRVGDNDTIELSWPRVPGADFYRVAVYKIDFQQIFSETTVDTQLVLNIHDLAGEAGTDDTLQWRIEALRGGEVLERSQLGVIKLRR